MITYIISAADLVEEQIQGLFSYWGTPPTLPDILRIFQGSDHVVLAIDEERGQVIGYITAISDGVSAAYIPHLEVRENWQGEGIGSELVRRMLEQLRHLYMIDLICDEELQPFYQRLGFFPWTGMIIRNREVFGRGQMMDD
jgi:GNAT superfamily N-acetyltransferase